MTIACDMSVKTLIKYWQDKGNGKREHSIHFSLPLFYFLLVKKISIYSMSLLANNIAFRNRLFLLRFTSKNLSY
jgi:predicted class III extradiol MEMO1 family dioxygenase